MCFHTKQTADATKLKKRFNTKSIEGELKLSDHYHGFEHPKTPIITNVSPDVIQMFEWGIFPPDTRKTKKEIQNSTLNARLDELEEKTSFVKAIPRRCLVLVNGFYENQHRPGVRKSETIKYRHLIEVKGEEPFAFAGLWTERDYEGTKVQTYTILTTEAQGIMREIHNSALRMPVVLKKGSEMDWLRSNTTEKSGFITEALECLEINLTATNLEPNKYFQGGLF
jgi:putative SOS response-associated peptidase YedK